MKCRWQKSWLYKIFVQHWWTNIYHRQSVIQFSCPLSLHYMNSRLFLCVAFTCIHVRASTSSICLCLSLRCSLLFLLPRSLGISRTCLGGLSRCNWLTAGADCNQSVAQSWTKDKPLLPVKYRFMHFLAFLGLMNFWGQVGCFRKVLMTNAAKSLMICQMSHSAVLEDIVSSDCLLTIVISCSCFSARNVSDLDSPVTQKCAVSGDAPWSCCTARGGQTGPQIPFYTPVNAVWFYCHFLWWKVTNHPSPSLTFTP